MGWLIVMFDLPTDTKKERQSAAKFRNDLLDSGYLMLQYSIYVRCAVTLEKKARFISALKRMNPGTGNIQCLFITDTQWGQIDNISANMKKRDRMLSNKDGIGEQLQFW